VIAAAHPDNPVDRIRDIQKAPMPATKPDKTTANGARKNPKELRLHTSIARDLGLRIVSGSYRPGHVLAGEIEASGQLKVSRSAYREAVRMLAAKGLVQSRTRTGTRVSAVEQWHLLDPDVLAWVFAGEPELEVLQGLFELRTIIEPEAAAIAAARRSDKNLEVMHSALERMGLHTVNVEAGRIADRDFHSELLRATRNPFIISLTNGVAAAVHALTEFKQREHALERDPLPEHWRVLEAIEAKDTERARASMAELIRLAITDMPVKRWPDNWTDSRLIRDSGQ
jgi:DNA-binding FadR family transcriptional regulator